MSDDEQPTQTAEELLHAVLLSSGTQGLESWRATLELLDGWIAVALEHGWSDGMARALVYEQTRFNLRLTVLNAEAVTRP